jgi:hypothetical protein
MPVVMTNRRLAPRKQKQRSCASPSSSFMPLAVILMDSDSNTGINRTSDENEGSIIMSLISQLR